MVLISSPSPRYLRHPKERQIQSTAWLTVECPGVDPSPSDCESGVLTTTVNDEQTARSQSIVLFSKLVLFRLRPRTGPIDIKGQLIPKFSLFAILFERSALFWSFICFSTDRRSVGSSFNRLSVTTSGENGGFRWIIHSFSCRQKIQEFTAVLCGRPIILANSNLVMTLVNFEGWC